MRKGAGGGNRLPFQMFSTEVIGENTRLHSPAIAFWSSRQSFPDVLTRFGAADESGQPGIVRLQGITNDRAALRVY